MSDENDRDQEQGRDKGRDRGDSSGDTGSKSTIAELRRRVAALEEKNDSLLSDNAKYRQRLRDSKNAPSDRLAGDGDLILRGDEVKRWNALNKLADEHGDIPEIRRKLADGQSAVAERDALRSSERRREVAELHDWKPTVFDRLAKADGLVLEIGDRLENGRPVTDRDGTPVRAGYVVQGEGDQAKKVPVDEYVKAHCPEMLDALSAGKSRPAPGTPSAIERREQPPVDRADNRVEREMMASGLYSGF